MSSLMENPIFRRMPVDVQIHTLKINAQKILDGIHGNMSSGKKGDLALTTGYHLVAGGVSGALAGAGISKALKVPHPIALTASLGAMVGLGEAGWNILARLHDEKKRRENMRDALSNLVVSPTNANAIHALHTSSQGVSSPLMRKLDQVIPTAASFAREKGVTGGIKHHYFIED